MKKVFKIIGIVIVVLIVLLFVFLYGVKAIRDADFKKSVSNSRESQLKGMKEIEYEVPEGFVESAEKDSVIVVEYEHVEDDINCSFTIQNFNKKENNALTTESMAKSNIDVSKDEYEQVDGPNEVEINGIKYVTEEFNVEKEGPGFHFMWRRDFYYFESSNYLFKVHYDIADDKLFVRDDIDTNTCMVSLEKLINSIKVK